MNNGKPIWKVTFVLDELRPYVPTTIKEHFFKGQIITSKQMRDYAAKEGMIVEISQWRAQIVRHTSLQILLKAVKVKKKEKVYA